jgi:hypothetical protein
MIEGSSHKLPSLVGDSPQPLPSTQLNNIDKWQLKALLSFPIWLMIRFLSFSLPSHTIWTHLKQLESLSCTMPWTLACILVLQIMSSPLSSFFFGSRPIEFRFKMAPKS